MAQEHPARLVHRQVPAEEDKGELSQSPENLGASSRPTGAWGQPAGGQATPCLTAQARCACLAVLPPVTRAPDNPNGVQAASWDALPQLRLGQVSRITQIRTCQLPYSPPLPTELLPTGHLERLGRYLQQVQGGLQLLSHHLCQGDPRGERKG